MRIFENLHVDWLRRRRLFYILSISLFLIGWVSVILRGFVFGIDFKGGTEIVLQFNNPVDISQIRQYADMMGLGAVELKTFGGETGVLIRTELQNIPKDIFPRIINNINQWAARR